MLLRLLIFLFLISMPITLATAQDSIQIKQTGKVTRILSGDTIEIRANNRKIILKLLGITAPSQQYFRESHAALSKLVRGKTVSFQILQHNEFPVEARVFFNDVDVGLSQVRNGNAWTSAKIDEDSDSEYESSQKAAQVEAAGLWGASFKDCNDDVAKSENLSETEFVRADETVYPVSGMAKLQVIIGTDGNVISAKAVCGHPLLQTLAGNSATKLRFGVSGEYRIQGILTYNFKPKN